MKPIIFVGVILFGIATMSYLDKHSNHPMPIVKPSQVTHPMPLPCIKWRQEEYVDNQMMMLNGRPILFPITKTRDVCLEREDNPHSTSTSK